MMPGEYVRHGALNLHAGAAGAVPAGLAKLIEPAYFISSVKRDEMLRDGRGDEIDATIKQGRLAQAEIMRGHR